MENALELPKREPGLSCNARTKSGTGYCEHPAGWGTDHLGEGRCKLHGGASLAGRDHPMYKHGRRSATLPTRLLADFHQAMNDPALLSLREDIATIDARIIDLQKRLDTGEAGNLWRLARTAMSRFKSARESSTMEAETKRHIMAEALDELDRLIVKGTSDYRAWDEIAKAMNDRRRMIDSEHKRAVAMGQMMSADAVLTLVDSINKVINDVVSDPTIRAKVAVGIMSLIDKDADYTEGEFEEM